MQYLQVLQGWELPECGREGSRELVGVKTPENNGNSVEIIRVESEITKLPRTRYNMVARILCTSKWWAARPFHRQNSLEPGRSKLQGKLAGRCVSVGGEKTSAQ